MVYSFRQCFEFVLQYLHTSATVSLKDKKARLIRVDQAGFLYSVSLREKLKTYIKGAITSATTDINFNRMFNDGPEVSLNGSPTVSPTTVALCASDPL